MIQLPVIFKYLLNGFFVQVRVNRIGINYIRTSELQDDNRMKTGMDSDCLLQEIECPCFFLNPR